MEEAKLGSVSTAIVKGEELPMEAIKEPPAAPKTAKNEVSDETKDDDLAPVSITIIPNWKKKTLTFSFSRECDSLTMTIAGFMKLFRIGKKVAGLMVNPKRMKE